MLAVGREGFEPPTPGSSGPRSTAELPPQLNTNELFLPCPGVLYPKFNTVSVIPSGSISTLCCSGRVFFRLVGPVLMNIIATKGNFVAPIISKL